MAKHYILLFICIKISWLNGGVEESVFILKKRILVTDFSELTYKLNFSLYKAVCGVFGNIATLEFCVV